MAKGINIYHDGTDDIFHWDGRINVDQGTLASPVLELKSNHSTTTIPNLIVGNSGAGDASIRFGAAAQSYWVGVDNSLSDRFSISNGANVSANVGLTIDSNNRVGIGDANVAPDISGALTITSTGLAFIPPRMTTAQMTAITGPPNGSLVFNSTSGALSMYSGAWVQIS